MPTVRDIVTKTTGFLKEKGVESARLDSELLVAAALGWERLQVFLKLDYPLSEPELEKCRDFVRRRAKGEPVAYILGQKGFYQNNFEVNASTLIPRPETEMLVERGLEILSERGGDEPTELLVVDLGCGTGCIGLSIAASLGEIGQPVKVILVDASQEAVNVAHRNAVRLGVQESCEFICGDAGDTATVEQWLGQAALVVANPPYIDNEDTRVQAEVRAFEPAQALFAEEHGLREVRRWSVVAKALVDTQGATLFEIGDGQGAQAKELFNEAGWPNVSLANDLSNRERMIEARSGS